MNIYGIFSGHSDFPAGIIKATESILGKQNNYALINNIDKNNEIIYEEIKKIIEKHNSLHIFLFIDFYGSSFSIPAITLSKQFNNLTLIFGYNLPIIIDFFVHRTKKQPNELYNKLIEIGKNAIK